MRKSLIVAALAAALAFCTNASAQRYTSSHFGLMGGFTSSATKIKDVDSKSVSLYHIGLTAQLPVGGGFAIQPSVLYQVKGASADDMGDLSIKDAGKSFETKVGYLEVPVQIQWGPDLMFFRPYAFAEPFVGYRISSSNKENAKVLKDELKKVEYGLGLGVGIDVWAFSCARNIVIVGDLKQLPNVLTEDDIRTSDAIWQEYSLDERYRFSTHSLLSSALEIWQDAPATLQR